MLKTLHHFPWFPWTFHRLFSGLCRVYKTSRLLRIGSVAATTPIVLILCGIIYVSYNRTDLPDLDAFLRFEPPTTGHIYDANGHVLIELARERREIIQYKDIPEVLRQAILSAEDENFFSHAGVDYSVFPRLLGKTNFRALLFRRGGPNRENAREPWVAFPQGGSTITQQLVRGYFLQRLTSTKTSNTLQHQGLFVHALAILIGVPAANKVLLKVEEMLSRCGLKERCKNATDPSAGPRKNYSPVTPASFTWGMGVMASQQPHNTILAYRYQRSLLMTPIRRHFWRASPSRRANMPPLRRTIKNRFADETRS